MTRHWYASFDPLLQPAEAEAVARLCARFGSYKMYSEEPTFAGIGEGLPARWDAARNFVRTGGRLGRSEPLPVLAARTNYFRETAPVDRLRPGMRLRCAGDDRWRVEDDDTSVAEYRWDELRFSVSWKAYCFADEAERATWAAHGDDLSVESAVDRLVDDLRARGTLTGARPGDAALVDLIIDEYIRFPRAVPADSRG